MQPNPPTPELKTHTPNLNPYPQTHTPTPYPQPPNPPTPHPNRYYQMAHMREEKITQQPSLLRPPPGAALREYQVRRHLCEP